MTQPASASEAGLPARRSVVPATLLMAWLCAWSVLLAGEYSQLGDSASTGQLLERLLAADWDTLVYLALLVTAPLAWGAGRWLRRRSHHADARDSKGGTLRSFLNGERGGIWQGVLWSLVVAMVSLGASASVGSHFGDAPPAYHDEYSYLLQAQTFLAGKASYPSFSEPRLFDQVHVLNEGRFASRYFPGTGLWMAPFVALGHPYWGHWCAGALCAALLFWAGRELGGDFCGLLAGLLTALAPGMALFSNLLLAHHPTLVGLSLFLWSYLRGRRLSSAGWMALAGVGLTYAALCRPMTAAGVGLPFGIDFLVWLSRGAPGMDVPSNQRRQHALAVLVAMAAPILVGGVIMFCYDRAITGSGWQTPYGLYTEIYTPRHRYGFNNVVLGEQHLGPRVLENYDRWAENLTPSLAARNTVRRLWASWKWTLGLIPLTFSAVAGLGLWKRLPYGAKLTLAGIVSLHAAHVPYWFVGMEDYHYVFESGPLWCLWLACVSVALVEWCRTNGGTVVSLWWLALVAAAVWLNYGVGAGLWSAPLPDAIVRVRFARESYRRFNERLEREAPQRPAIILIEADPADRHIDYVTNSPDLSGTVLRGHYLPDVMPVEEVARLFPERAVYLYRARTGAFVFLR